MLVWEFQTRMEGIYDRELSEWKRTRWLATWIVKPYKDVQPSDLLPLPDDVKRKKIPEGHFDAMLKRYKKYKNGNSK